MRVSAWKAPERATWKVMAKGAGNRRSRLLR
jgi:hypothetical protein